MSVAAFLPKSDKDGESSTSPGGTNQKRTRKRTTDLEPSPPIRDNSKRIHYELPPEGGMPAVSIDPSVTLFQGDLYRIVKQTSFDVERELCFHMRPLGLNDTVLVAILQRVRSSGIRVEASLSQLAHLSHSPTHSFTESFAATSHPGPCIVLAKLQVHLPDTCASTASASASSSNLATTSNPPDQLFDVLSLELCCLLHSVWRESQQTYNGGSLQLSVSISHAGADVPDSATTCLIEPLLQLVERGYPDDASLALLRRLRLVLVPREALSLRPDMLDACVSGPEGPLAVPLVNLVWQLFQHPLPLSKASSSPPPPSTSTTTTTTRGLKLGERASSPSGTTCVLYYSATYTDSPRNPNPNETSSASSNSPRAANKLPASVREDSLESSPAAASSDSEQLSSPTNKRRRVGASPRAGREAGEAAEGNAASDAASTRFLEFACK